LDDFALRRREGPARAVLQGRIRRDAIRPRPVPDRQAFHDNGHTRVQDRARYLRVLRRFRPARMLPAGVLLLAAASRTEWRECGFATERCNAGLMHAWRAGFPIQ